MFHDSTGGRGVDGVGVNKGLSEVAPYDAPYGYSVGDGEERHHSKACGQGGEGRGG